MNRRQRRMVAIVVAVLAGFFLYSQFRNRKAAAAEAARLQAQRMKEEEEKRKKLLEQITYVVPTEIIPRRTVITDSMVRIVSAAKKDIPWAQNEENFKKVRGRYPDAVEKVVGKIALVELGPKEPIRAERLASKNDIRAISFVIPPGKRAVTIRMDAVRGVGGFIRQGDFVDILGTFKLPGSGETITKPILQRVKVLIVDRTYFRPKTAEEIKREKQLQKEKGTPPRPQQANPNIGVNMAMVTFEVTPEEAEKLILADQRIQPLVLALRNPVDPENLGPEVIAEDQDIFVDPNRPPPEPKGKVTVILGRSKTVKDVGN